MGFEPIPHCEVRSLAYVSLKHLQHDVLRLGVRLKHLRLRIVHKAKGNQAAILYAFLGPHTHLGTDFFSNLLILKGLDSHEHGFKQASCCRVTVSRIMDSNELHIVVLELFIQDIEVTAANQPVIPGADHAIYLFRFHQPTQPA